LISELIGKFQRYSWYLMIAALPITSMPLVRRLLRADSVASPAIIFLLIFFIAWLVNGLLNEIWIPKSAFGLILFSLIAIISSLLSVFYEFPLFKNFGYFQPMVAAVATLIIGFLFFLAASSYPLQSDLKANTLRIINYSGFVILIWSIFQAVSWYTRHGYPQWMFNFQGILSTRVLYRQRVTGFALEPSWLAHQLNLLYLPYWLSATLMKYSSHKFRIFGFSIENFLLFGGILMLALTLSRVGFAAFLLMLGLAAILTHSRLVEKIEQWLLGQFKNFKIPSRWVISVLILFFYLFLTVSGLMIYSKVDPRMANIFSLTFAQDNPLLRYFDELKFGDRVIYWLTGWNIFNDFPVLGVGLGNAGFFFPDKIPAFGWSLIEVRKLMYRSQLLLNVKSLWFRLLAESGIVGFAFFIGWIFSLLPAFIRKYKSKQKLDMVFGLMGAMTILALFFEGFSIDSFAMPYWWVSLGIAVASNKQ